MGNNSIDLTGKTVLITAGPTHEKIDDVRYIANYSSGKMGFALAESASKLGADVTIVAGPVTLSCSESIERIDVISAEEMYQATINKYNSTTFDIIICASAVADFTPKNIASGKIKKTSDTDTMLLELMKTKDILARLGEIKTDSQYLIGFALEAKNEIEYGRGKLEKKNCDMIVVNSANKTDSGFGGDNNTITLLKKDGSLLKFEPQPKSKCADIIFEKMG